MARRFARVYPVVPGAHLDQLFDYVIPDGMTGAHDLRLGSAARIYFHGVETTGWVMETADTTEVPDHKLVDLDGIVRTPPFFDPADAAAWRWIADRFSSTFAAVTRHAIPKRVKHVEREFATWGGGAPAPAAHRIPKGRIAQLQLGWHDDGHELLIERVRAALAEGYQAHIITPLPACPVADAMVRTFGRQVLDMRGEQGQTERYRSFWRWRLGHARVLIGTRSSALWPAQTNALGLLAVIDEANPAYKNQRSPRFHVRETALVRAGTHGCEVLFTSHLPSAQLTRLIAMGHVDVEAASRQQIEATSPAMHMVDRTTLPIGRRGRFAGPVIEEMNRVVKAGGRVIVVAAMRGSGRSIGCQSCKRRLRCPDCGAGLAPKGRAPLADAGAWECVVCSWDGQPFACPACGEEKRNLKAAGVASIAKELTQTFPGVEVATMEGFNAPGPEGRPAIAVMTRGSVVASPAWLRGERADLAVIVDPDVLLGRPSFDAAEDAFRLWADTAHLADKVIIQTYEPDHHAITAFSLINPGLFWDREMERRQAFHFPPAGHVIRFEHMTVDTVTTLRDALADQPDVLVFGPDEAGGAFLSTPNLRPTLKALDPLRREWAKANAGIRIDVDPNTI